MGASTCPLLRRRNRRLTPGSHLFLRQDSFRLVWVAKLFALHIRTFILQSRCRCNTDFWFTLGYVPNLSYGKGKADQTDSTTKLQDQHNCIRAITDQIVKLRHEGYFYTEVMGRKVKVVVWVHVITGDTSGHNKMCGKYNSNGNTSCPYRHCFCKEHNLSVILRPTALF